jgi:hypothetical protein
MELLLNLAWILLVLPGYWLWRRSTDSSGECCASSRQCLLSLGCALVLLFPVISATDDLHAMRDEMEESSVSKRAVRPAGEKHSAWVNRLQGSPALAATANWLPAFESQILPISFSYVATHPKGWSSNAGRAPPSLFG